MRRAIYPGSFDPITNGHLDVIDRATQLFDEVIVAVAVNPAKHGLFTIKERAELIREVIGDKQGVTVTSFHGLLVKFAEDHGATAVVRGLRAVTDFEFEFQMALMNRKLRPGFETIFLASREEYTYLSASIVKEVARLKGDISGFVPEPVALALRKKFRD